MCVERGIETAHKGQEVNRIVTVALKVLSESPKAGVRVIRGVVSSRCGVPFDYDFLLIVKCRVAARGCGPRARRRATPRSSRGGVAWLWMLRAALPRIARSRMRRRAVALDARPSRCNSCRRAMTWGEAPTPAPPSRAVVRTRDVAVAGAPAARRRGGERPRRGAPPTDLDDLERRVLAIVLQRHVHLLREHPAVGRRPRRRRGRLRRVRHVLVRVPLRRRVAHLSLDAVPVSPRIRSFRGRVPIRQDDRACRAPRRGARG